MWQAQRFRLLLRINQGAAQDSLAALDGKLEPQPHGTGYEFVDGVKGGLSYGQTDEYGYEAVENKVHIHDLHATILALLAFPVGIAVYLASRASSPGSHRPSCAGRSP